MFLHRLDIESGEGSVQAMDLSHYRNRHARRLGRRSYHQRRTEGHLGAPVALEKGHEHAETGCLADAPQLGPLDDADHLVGMASAADASAHGVHVWPETIRERLVH